MKSLLKNRARLWMETLEDRTVPTFVGVTGSIPDAAGNVNLTLITSGTALTITQTAATQITLADGAGGNLIINNVFGNISINAKTNQAGAFLTTITPDGSFGGLTGNVSLTLGRTLGATAVDARISGANTPSILGNVTVTTNTAGPSTVSLNPLSLTTIVGNVTTNLLGGTLASLKSVNAQFTQINGNFYSPNVNVFQINDNVTVLGTTTVSTKATSSVANIVDVGATNNILGNLSVTMGNVSGTGSSTVNLGGTVNGFATIRLGTNTGANTTNVVNLESGAIFNGSLISITGGNGSKQINVAGITAGAAKLLVSLGNALDNEVNFTGTNSLLEATLVGGTGTNTVTGTVDFPLRLFRFSF